MTVLPDRMLLRSPRATFEQANRTFTEILINPERGRIPSGDHDTMAAEICERKSSSGDTGMDIKLPVRNGWVVLPASLKSPDGQPRLHLTFPYEFASDAGANYLVRSEVKHGYELPTRNFLERLFQPGDLFIDVGAHWGFFTLQAATHPAWDVKVIAFEPDPTMPAFFIETLPLMGLPTKSW
jgi:hypothetical protein